MIDSLKAMTCDDSGVALVEYGVLLGLIALIAFVGVQALGVSLNGVFDAAEDAFRHGN